MVLKVTRFVAVLLAALTLGLGFCHLMHLPSRLAWDQYLWVGTTVQGGLYAMFGTVGALIEMGAVIVLALLAYFVREHGRPGFRLAAAAFVLYALALLLWWVIVYPVNVELAKWVNGPVPADWTAWRARWEWGHAVLALLELAGFAALVWSVLEDGPGVETRAEAVAELDAAPRCGQAESPRCQAQALVQTAAVILRSPRSGPRRMVLFLSGAPSFEARASC